MPTRKATKTIPGSTQVDRWWNQINLDIQQRANKLQPIISEYALSQILFTIIDRQSITVTPGRKTQFKEVLTIYSDLITNDLNKEDYARTIIFTHMIPDLLSIIRALSDPTDPATVSNLNQIDPEITNTPAIKQFLNQHYQLIISDPSRYFRANPNKHYLSTVELTGALNHPVSTIKSTYDLASLIFGLFDDNPYCHLFNDNQRKLGVGEWRIRRKPSYYSLRILGFIATCFKEFNYRDPANTQELIEKLLYIMFNLMRRINYLELKETLTLEPNYPDLITINQNLDTIAPFSVLYGAYENGQTYLQMQQSRANTIDRFRLEGI